MQLSNANPITHKYWLGPTNLRNLRCEECDCESNTTVWEDHSCIAILCWFCFAQKYGQIGNAVKGLYNGVPILRQFGG